MDRDDVAVVVEELSTDLNTLVVRAEVAECTRQDCMSRTIGVGVEESDIGLAVQVIGVSAVCL